MNIKISPQITQHYPEIITPFQPLFIKTSKYTKDMFLKDFPNISPEKTGILYKFASIKELLESRPFAGFHVDILNMFSLQKLKNIYPVAKLKDYSGLSRFSPEELISVLNLKNEEINFIKPFARKKKYNGIFAFTPSELLKISKIDKVEKSRFMDLSNTNLDFKSMNLLVKDKNINTADFASAVRKIQDDFAENIANMGIAKVENKYFVKFFTKTPFKTHIVPYKPTNSGTKMTDKRFFAIQKINEKIDEIKELNIKVNKHNSEVLIKNKGKLKNYTFSLPPNLIINEWKAGNLDKEDISMFFTEAAGLVSREDFTYFGERGFRLTPFDNEKIINDRKYTLSHRALSKNSHYYKEKESEILSKMFKKLDKIDANLKFIIVDGFSGSGKTTAINDFLKGKNETYFSADSDEVKAEFEEYYKGGIGANLVHSVAGKLFKEKIIPKALQDGKNIIFQTTCTFESLNKIIQKVRKNGYSIDYINVNTPLQTSILRSNNRHKTNGRYMDPYLILSRARENNSAKENMAKVLSYYSSIDNSYNYQSGILTKIENGVDGAHFDLSEKKSFLDKFVDYFRQMFKQ